MKRVPNEAALRDFLAEHLDMIEPGLTPVETELHLANPNGASGFLDIFARAAGPSSLPCPWHSACPTLSK